MKIATSSFSYGLLSAALCALAFPTQAALVTWDTPKQITNASDVSLNGTLIGAVNLDGPAASVNGVNFQALDINAGPASVGNFSLDGFFFNQFGAGFTGSGAAPFTGLSPGYQSLLGSAAVVAGTMTLTMTGLTLGQDYEFQAWVNDSRNQTPPGFTFKVLVSAGNDVELDPNPSLAEGGLGQYVLGTFKADNAIQQVTFTNDEVGVISGFQLRQVAPAAVPEPGTALAGLICAGLCAGSRRRNRKTDPLTPRRPSPF